MITIEEFHLKNKENSEVNSSKRIQIYFFASDEGEIELFKNFLGKEIPKDYSLYYPKIQYETDDAIIIEFVVSSSLTLNDRSKNFQKDLKYLISLPRRFKEYQECSAYIEITEKIFKLKHTSSDLLE